MIEQGNYDDYLKSVGVRLIDRKVEGSVSARIYIANDGDNYAYREFAGQVREFTFRIVQEFQIKYFNFDVTCNITLLSDNKMQQSIRDSNGKRINIIRSFDQDGMSEELDCVDDSVIAKRKFKRI